MSGRLLLDSKSSASANMAIDESLLRHAQAPVLRLYGWEEVCVSIGYFQKTSVVPAETSFVRRYTGEAWSNTARISPTHWSCPQIIL